MNIWEFFLQIRRWLLCSTCPSEYLCSRTVQTGCRQTSGYGSTAVISSCLEDYVCWLCVIVLLLKVACLTGKWNVYYDTIITLYKFIILWYGWFQKFFSCRLKNFSDHQIFAEEFFSFSDCSSSHQSDYSNSCMSIILIARLRCTP